MTDIITRYFEDPADARAVRFELIHRQRFPLRIIGLYESAEGLADALIKADVDPETAQEYQKRVKKSGSVLLVRAGYKPLSVGRTTREVLTAMGAKQIDGLNEENFVKSRENPKLSVLQDHPHMMFRPRDPLYDNVHMANWPFSLISRRKPTTASVIEPHGRMASWPIGLLLSGKTRFGRFPFDLLLPGSKRYGAFPFGLLLPGSKRYGNFPFGLLLPGTKRYGNFPFGLLLPGTKRYGKFPFGYLTPRGMRMASWPFPLLINGRQGANSLVPGHKYMAKFPFAHLVPGHKYYADFPIGHKVPHNRRYGRFPFGLLVPGQKYMAKFPFAHIVPGHKHYANFPIGLLVPGHKYMANWIFPHTKTKAS